MTADLQSELAEVLVLLEKATPGEWFTGHLCRDDHACNCPFIFSEGQIGMGAIATVGTTDEDVGSEAEAKANQAVIVAAVNFLRKHGAAISALSESQHIRTVMHIEHEGRTFSVDGWAGPMVKRWRDAAMAGGEAVNASVAIPQSGARHVAHRAAAPREE